ncbi:uncharacterized protein Z520_03661 [Fonsecaea multimorphosa CBS 102226]|uniref:FAD-binding domain-containing protein n=1 Tax=Fonsecaea multimorphosa CBS 102226 TaxID=1442371 RepID=A0A0D2KCU3_9EURO|nr:uncharacterized protein Z520_03661 [Fonsecaea multimorphosa CBS 102226]KIY00995.1 hypothetical protein Z520_03661 [Fonsecaea multimorphosa CBS 102226]
MATQLEASGINGLQEVTTRPNGMSDKPSSQVLIVGAAVVGCLTAIQLAQAGIDSEIIEMLPKSSDDPRSCGYFGAAQLFLDELGIYKLMRSQGFMTRGLCWRTAPIDDGKGGKRTGDIIASQPLCALDDTVFPVGSGLLNLTQGQLNRICIQEALKTGRVRIHFNTQLESVDENTADGVVVTARDVNSGETKQYRGKYLVGADGARSATRKALGLAFPGYTWPERLLATNVMVMNEEEILYHTHYVMSDVHWAVITPLQDPVVGQSTLWRYTVALDPNDPRPDDEIISDANILNHYESIMAGRRPLQVEIRARSIYNIHQRLAPTLRKGNCLLAGDAAHVNNPIGAMGLNTGMLDSDALGKALIMILKEGRSDSVLDIYNDERRKVFQFFVNPTSAENKMRVHHHPPETAVRDDWYFRMMADPSKLTEDQLKESMKPYMETWRTDIRKLAKSMA